MDAIYASEINRGVAPAARGEFAPLRLASGAATPGEIRRLRVTAATGDALLAEAA